MSPANAGSLSHGSDKGLSIEKVDEDTGSIREGSLITGTTLLALQSRRAYKGARRGCEVTPKVPGEVSLVVETHLDGDLGGRRAGEETSSGLLDPSADQIAMGWKLNVTAFVISGIGTGEPELIGEDYLDGSGRAYLPMLGIPVLVFGGDATGIRRAFDRALARDLMLGVCTEDLFATGNDVDNRAAVAGVATGDLVVAGFSVAGEGTQVDKAFDRLKLHP